MASVGRDPGTAPRSWMGRLSGGDPLFGNKVAGAVLSALLLGVGLNIFSEIIYTPRKPAVPGYDLPAPEVSEGGAAEAPAAAEPIAVRLASADPAKGQSAAKKCLACHIFDKGGPNKIGPNLFGVVERPKGSHEGFGYSSAMKGKGGAWSFDDLDHFLTNPKAYVPGTIMAFAGVSSPKERADIIDYLHTLADSPVPLPKPEPAAAKDPAAVAPTAAPAGTKVPDAGAPPTAPFQQQPSDVAPKPADPQPAPAAPKP